MPVLPPSPPRFTLSGTNQNLLEDLRLAKSEVATATPRIQELEVQRDQMQQVLNANQMTTETLISELRDAHESTRQVEHFAENIVTGVRTEESAVVQAESHALLRHTLSQETQVTRMIAVAEAKHATALHEKDAQMQAYERAAAEQLTSVRSYADAEYNKVRAERDALQIEIRHHIERIAVLEQGPWVRWTPLLPESMLAKLRPSLTGSWKRRSW